MPWIELRITTTAEYANPLGNQLLLLGAQTLTMQDAGDHPIYEPTPGSSVLWQDTVVIGLFDLQQSLEPITAYLEKQKNAGLIAHFNTQQIADEDWERRCLDHFKPMRFGKRLWICPSWQIPPDPQAVNVILDPGLAFGTGTHPTTALCLEWLDNNINSGETVIDYGCGSGILAIAALKLGAHQVFAIDHDTQAIDSTKENGKRNHLYPPKLKTGLPKDFNLPAADILIANILAQPLIELAPQFAKLAKPQSSLLLSGILINQANEVIKAYQPWFNMDAAINKEEWVRLTGVRK